jgi:putative flavoprotein involved in K+ transport
MNGARSVDTVVVGAGQAGLLMSWHLRQAGREHVVLDRRPALGGGWQDRWDAFCLVGPNWMLEMPGSGPIDDPDGFMSRDELVAHFRRYGAAIEAPVELGVDVTGLSAADDGAKADRFALRTSAGPIRARNVVVAGGPFQRPSIPAVAEGLSSSILSLHSHDYRNPGQLPPGRVLLVGSGQTGVQLAEELMAAGREVLMSVGRCWRAPRRYRGQDIFWWLRQLTVRGPEFGIGLPRVEQLPSPAARFACNPQLSGHDGGHSVDLRRMALDGLRLAGRLDGLDGTTARFRADLTENLRYGDANFPERLQRAIDGFAAAIGHPVPPDPEPAVDHDPPETTELDLAAEGVTSIIWTSGYRPDFGWIDLPVIDEQGLPRQTGGQTDVPGLTFLGTPWLVDMGSANLVGVIRDAELLAARW